MSIIKENMLKNEKNLNEFASFNKDAVRFNDNKEDIRGEYFRDIDRIIYSLSYVRYIDKTQVFSFNENDNITRRMIHVQLVSKIARTISRALNLNEDLSEAIALGHDIGHVPFGHTGEKILNDISLKYDNTYFMHNIESVRNLMYIENNGNGLNLTLQVLDGIMCHNGEFVSDKYYPKNKTKEDFIKEYNNCYKDIKVASSLIPMTLEGCVVRISDIIAYLGRDIEDAVRIGIFDIESIPVEIKQVLGTTNKEIVNKIILDIIDNSVGKPYIKMSDEVYKAIKNLKDFNYKNIYTIANTNEQLEYYNIVFNEVFNFYLNNIKEDNNINKYFLNYMSDSYLKNTSDVRKVIDYIAGMTDDFIITEYEKIKKINE